MPEQATLIRGWSIEGFRRFWTKPDLALIPRVRDICTPDIVGHWPGPIGRVEGAGPYVDVIAAIFAVCPDFALTVPEYAAAGDLHFVRWAATGTLQRGPIAFDGVDRVRTTADGLVSENYVCSGGALFEDVADHLAGRRG